VRKRKHGKVREGMRWNVVAKRFREYFAVCVLLVLGAISLAGCDNRETILMIEKPTEVHSIDQAPSSSSESTNANVQPGRGIATLKAGETAKAIGVYHGQEYDGFQVKLADGSEGIILAGDTFKVVSR
jgi:hypothetical protein